MKNNRGTLSEKTRELAFRARRLNEKTLRLSKKNVSVLAGDLAAYCFLTALSIIFLVPFFYIISRSLMSAKDLADINVQWIPRELVFENYSFAAKILEYGPRLLYSLLTVGISVFAQVLSSAFVAYGLARIRFRGRGIIFGLIIATMIIPPQTIIVTQYLMYARVNLLNTMLPVILPCFFSLGLNGGLFVFLFRQFFRSMPKELENAALIDGAGIMGAFFRIILPNSGGTVLVTALLSFIWQWNNFFEPSIYITDRSRFTLTMMLSNLSASAAQFKMGGFNNGINLAGTFLCALPVILVFFIAQRRFVKGIENSGLAN